MSASRVITPKEAIEKVRVKFMMEHLKAELAFERPEAIAAMQAEHDAILATLRHHLIPRTTPPTVEEVGDDELCLGFIDRDANGVPALWGSFPGKDVRDFWGPGYTKWLPLPTWEEI
jgi:hypothetical protein